MDAEMRLLCRGCEWLVLVVFPSLPQLEVCCFQTWEWVGVPGVAAECFLRSILGQLQKWQSQFRIREARFEISFGTKRE